MTPPVVPFFIAHQGCPHQCVFCDQLQIAGTAGVLPTAGEIERKIATWLASSGCQTLEVAYFGGTFTGLAPADQRRLLLPLQPLIASGKVCAVTVSTRPDAITPENTAFLREMGVTTVELGVQSMADDVLKLARRGHDSHDVQQAIDCLKCGGMRVGGQLMPGLPGDTPVKSRQSLQRLLALRPDFLRIYPTLVIAGTPLAELYRQGSYAPLPLPAAVSLCKELLHMAMQGDVPVVRIGLQPTDELQLAGVVVAGPFHPAFRQLVEGELCLDLLQKLTAGVPGGTPVTIHSHPARVSDVTGQCRINLRHLQGVGGLQIARVVADLRLGRHELTVDFPGGSRTGNLLRDLDYAAL
jgi:histone acetyltransferase (RNA polymerase elongator complex component)